MNHMQFLAKTENDLCSLPLKWNKDSCLIKISLLESLLSLASSLITCKPQQHQRHGRVIIYTHSPKIIHTDPKDFMSLVQKLTGLTRTEEEGLVAHGHESSDMMMLSNGEDNKNTKMIQLGNNDTESSSVITDENCSNVGNINVNQVNFCFVLPIFEPPLNPYMDDMPIFMLNSTKFLCCNQSFYGCIDSLFFHTKQ